MKILIVLGKNFTDLILRGGVLLQKKIFFLNFFFRSLLCKALRLGGSPNVIVCLNKVFLVLQAYVFTSAKGSHPKYTVGESCQVTLMGFLTVFAFYCRTCCQLRVFLFFVQRSTLTAFGGCPYRSLQWWVSLPCVETECTEWKLVLLIPLLAV